MDNQNKLNANRTYIYTEQCVTCGNTEEYQSVANKLKLKHKDVFVKQTPLFVGWMQEAMAIGLPMPFVYDCDTGNKLTCAEFDNMSEEELDDWLGIRE